MLEVGLKTTPVITHLDAEALSFPPEGNGHGCGAGPTGHLNFTDGAISDFHVSHDMAWPHPPHPPDTIHAFQLDEWRARFDQDPVALGDRRDDPPRHLQIIVERDLQISDVVVQLFNHIKLSFF